MCSCMKSLPVPAPPNESNATNSPLQSPTQPFQSRVSCSPTVAVMLSWRPQQSKSSVTRMSTCGDWRGVSGRGTSQRMIVCTWPRETTRSLCMGSRPGTQMEGPTPRASFSALPRMRMLPLWRYRKRLSMPGGAAPRAIHGSSRFHEHTPTDPSHTTGGGAGSAVLPNASRRRRNSRRRPWPRLFIKSIRCLPRCFFKNKMSVYVYSPPPLFIYV